MCLSAAAHGVYIRRFISLTCQISEMAVFFVIFFITLSVLSLLLRKRKNVKLPPGPIGLPVVGSLWSVNDDLHLYFTKLSNKYGAVCGLWFGNRYTVILSGPEVIREAYRRAEFSGRPFNYLVKVYNPNFTGIVDASFSPTWKAHRKFAVKSMSGFGLGRSSFESQILAEAKELVSSLRSHATKLPFDPSDFIVAAISNLVCVIVFGRRFEYSDDEFQKILRMLRATFASLVEDKSRDYLPILRLIPNEFVRNHEKLFEEIKAYLRRQIQLHSECLTSEPKDYIDAFLLEQKSGNMDFTEDWLVNILFDFFAAGTETTATAIRWTLLYLSKYPEVQERMYREIRDRVLADREVSFEDQRSMPYCEAVMCEIFRLCSVAPLALVHSTMSEAEIGGFVVPEGSDVYLNLWAMHHDSKYWEDPEKFMPERFLIESGHCRTDKLAYLPFGTGIRACLGEQLAKMEYFLILTTILREFEVRPSDQTDLRGNYKLVFEPVDCEMVLVSRLKPRLHATER